MRKNVLPYTRVSNNLVKNNLLKSVLAILGIIASTTINAQVNPSTHKESSLTKPAAHQATPWDKKIHLNGITITPGGFFAGENVWRSRTLQADMASPFQNIPMLWQPLAHMSEFVLSARQSRISALVEGNYNPNTLISGYIEMDFLGSGTANWNESSSFNPRMRNIYSAIDWTDTGWHLLAGQNWSLITTNFKGISPRNEVVPPTIEAQYVVGFAWKRDAQFRLTKSFNDAIWAAVSIENPQTVFGGGTICNSAELPPGIIHPIACSAPGAGNNTNLLNFSFNHIPDVVGKLAYEPKIEGHKFHLESFGLYRDFYNRVQYTNKLNANRSTTGYGVGFGGLLEVVSKRIDIQGNVLFGQGIGSYLTGSLPDVTIASSTGELTPIPEIGFMAGVTLHATAALDFYVFGGQEKMDEKYFRASNGAYFGYGVPDANNTGCYIESPAATVTGGPSPNCAGATQQLWQVTAGLWDKFYQGSFGELRLGLQYSYTKRELFQGTGGNVKHPLGASSNDNMVFGSIRYYPFIVSETSSAVYVK